MKRVLIVLLMLMSTLMVVAQETEAETAASIVDEVSALLMEDDRDLDLALERLNEAIELDADYAPAYNYRGDVHYYLKNDDESLTDYEKAIELDPNYALAIKNLGVWHAFANNDHETAVTFYEQAIEVDPDFLPSYVELGYSYLIFGENEQGIDSITIAIDGGLDDASGYLTYAYNIRGINYFRLSDYESAAADFTRAIEVNPTNVQYYLNRADANNRRGEYQSAIDDYTTATELDPNDPYNYFDRGRIYVKLGNFEDAIADFSTAIGKNSRVKGYFVARAEAYTALDNLNAAYKDWDAAIALDPDDRTLYEDKLLIATPQQRIDTYTDMIDRFGDDNVVWLQDRAVAYVDSGNLESGLADLDSLEALGQADYAIAELRGDLYAEAGLWEDAIVSYETVLELNPNFGDDVLLDIGHMQVQLGDYDAAKDLLDLYREDNDDFLGLTDALEAEILIGRGELDAAEPLVDDLRSGVNGRVWALQPEAMYFMARENYEDALTVLDEAMMIESNATLNNPRVDTIIQMMRAEANMMLGNRDLAMADYDAVLMRNAEFVPALLGKAQVFITLDDDMNSAQPLLETALELDPDNEIAQGLME